MINNENSMDKDSKLSLYHNGSELMEQLGLTFESVVLFSDYCELPIFIHPERIKYTKYMLLFCDRDRFLGYEFYDWLEWDRIEICPWENILEINVMKGVDIKRSIKREEIDTWLSQLNDQKMDFPFSNIRKGEITIIVEGRPHSERSKKGSENIRNIIKSFGPQIRNILPVPISKPIQIGIDVFSLGSLEIPDIDRFTHPILDAFEGLIYEKDRQIKELKPRVFDSSKAIVQLECRLEPMGLYEIENIATGALYPLAKGVMNYYVIRVLY